MSTNGKVIVLKMISQNKTKVHKDRLLGAFSGLSGSLSFLGGWQVCHNVCLGIIALLSLIGVTVIGMPLLFLNQYAVYFWSAAVLLLIPTLVMYWQNRRCMSHTLIVFNAGIVIASVPFADLKAYQIAFWLTGGVLVTYSIVLFVRGKLVSGVLHRKA